MSGLFEPELEFTPQMVSIEVFSKAIWHVEEKLFLAARAACGWEILGPEILRNGEIIGSCPVREIVVKAVDSPSDLGLEDFRERVSNIAADVWASMSDDERASHPRIGEVALLADLSQFDV
jgi:hypothetical protein